MQRDSENDRDLTSLGWIVVRFWGKDVLKDPESCVAVIKDIIFDRMIAEKAAGGDAYNGEI